jgi:hypothetical protein
LNTRPVHDPRAGTSDSSTEGDDPQFFRCVIAGAGPYTTIVWSGYVRNALSLGLLSLLLCSMSRIPCRARRFRATRATAQSICPQCHYDLRHLDAAGCPECGWGRDDAFHAAVTS